MPSHPPVRPEPPRGGRDFGLERRLGVDLPPESSDVEVYTELVRSLLERIDRLDARMRRNIRGLR